MAARVRCESVLSELTVALTVIILSQTSLTLIFKYTVSMAYSLLWGKVCILTSNFPWLLHGPSSVPPFSKKLDKQASAFDLTQDNHSDRVNMSNCEPTFLFWQTIVYKCEIGASK